MRWSAFAIREARRTLDDWERRSGTLTPPIAVEDIADLLYSLSVDVTDSLPENMAGRLYGDERIIEVKKSDIHVRQRFTIAHEIGHYQLHVVAEKRSHSIHSCSADAVSAVEPHDVASLFGPDVPLPPRPQLARPSDVRRLEIEANRFAAEILMPAPLMEEAVHYYGPDLRTLAQLFDVSLQAMQFRLENLLYLPPPGPQTNFLTDL